MRLGDYGPEPGRLPELLPPSGTKIAEIVSSVVEGFRCCLWPVACGLLLVSQTLYRVELGGFAGGIVAEEDANAGGEQSGERHDAGGEFDVPLQRLVQHVSAERPGEHAEEA